MLKHGSKTRVQEEGQGITQHQFLKKGDAHISPLHLLNDFIKTES
jgi:hypothetical protein